MAARWTPDALAHPLAQALDLALLTGRDEVLDEVDGRASFAVDPFGQTFQEQIDFLTQKRPLPTKVWDDALHGNHDRAFTIAGSANLAMTEDAIAMVAEFREVILKTGAEANDIDAFAKEFDRIVAEYGWDYNGGRDWRIRTIFRTNMRTSHMAGRLKQMRDPDVVKMRPYWQYRHGELRRPKNPRSEHKSWDGMVLRHDDPWWETYFPPNDWQCSCGVRTLSERDMERLGKTGPDTAPPIEYELHQPKSGKPAVRLPKGTGYGWDYQPGNQWSQGLVPSAIHDEVQAAFEKAQASGAAPMQQPDGPHQLYRVDVPRPADELLAAARPFTTPLLPSAKSPDAMPDEEYVREFLRPFGADIGKPVLWQDVTGTKIAISDDLFRGEGGRWKVTKQGRELYAAQLAEVIMDPDEIWLGVRSLALDRVLPGVEDHILTRQYIRAGLQSPGSEHPASGMFATFDMGRKFWLATTGFKPGPRKKTNWAYMNNQRTGKLLWSRK
ncbi:MAG: PBECR2 nuclease fold domain-containing protein [Paracoccus sp. (in: a-proteobacteria)]|uniref:PBECR2 nuclease fold domain-containing protein n=1 Tax=Paracoccus sp. TaxID=267 RepID=UPI0026E09072|nr:PBECR2 nuclease fold domain-containing protein [Paracoccus sp. (in: a-proteobacteria)]MDO5614441.1 PBECR2 nuclease fold domain-containing protein [Paracoccus sp. (in: a-proteobacteria)]